MIVALAAADEKSGQGSNIPIKIPDDKSCRDSARIWDYFTGRKIKPRRTKVDG